MSDNSQVGKIGWIDMTVDDADGVRELRAVDLGDVERVVVGHDADGFGSGWHLHSVLVKDTDRAENNKFYFHCDRSGSSRKLFGKGYSSSYS